MSEKLSLSELKHRDWDDVESALLAVAELVKSDADATSFFSALLRRVVQCTQATGGVLWLRDAKGICYPAHQVGVADPSRVEAWRVLRQNAENAIDHELIEVVKLAAGTLHSALLHASGNPGVLQVVRPRNADIGVADPQTILEAFAELAGEYLERSELLQLRQYQRESAAWSDFAKGVHASLDPESVAYAIANDGCLLLECDRLSVIGCWNKRCKLLSVSGVDGVNRRSDLCRSLERLADYVTTSGDEIWYDGDLATLAPQLEAYLEQYTDQSHARRLAIFPLVLPDNADDGDDASPKVIGALVAESFDASRDAFVMRERMVQLTQLSAPALRNAMTHQHLPLMPLSIALQRASRFMRLRSGVLLAAALAIASVIVGLCVISAELEVEARGELLPLNRRNVFAATDGVIDQLIVDHGQFVRQGELLATMQRSELELAISQVSGRILTTQRAFNSVRARRLNSIAGSSDAIEPTTLAAEEEQLRLQLDGLKEQADILKRQQDELQICSPIDGQVITWDPARTLLDRPVQRGQQLLTIVEADGPWVVELKLADKDVGHVVRAQSDDPRGLRVSFLLATNPSEILLGRLQQVALATDRDADRDATVLLTVSPDQEIGTGARPGASVVANIDCGKTSLGYVWLHELVDTLRTTWLF